MNTMNIEGFTAADTPELIAFRLYWQRTKYPTLSYEDQRFYDFHATVWDWADQYELWSKNT